MVSIDPETVAGMLHTPVRGETPIQDLSTLDSLACRRSRRKSCHSLRPSDNYRTCWGDTRGQKVGISYRDLYINAQKPIICDLCVTFCIVDLITFQIGFVYQIGV